MLDSIKIQLGIIIGSTSIFMERKIQKIIASSRSMIGITEGNHDQIQICMLLRYAYVILLLDKNYVLCSTLELGLGMFSIFFM